MIHEWMKWIEANLNVSYNFQLDCLNVLTAFIILYSIRFIVLRVAFHYKKGIRVRYRWRKTTLYITTFVFMMIIGGIWIKGFSNFVTYLSFLSAGFAIALKDPILGMTAWLFILWKRPFEVGDRIQIGDFKGDVIDQRLFMFTLMEVGNWVDAEQSTGRVVHVPNGLLFQQPLVNYNKGFEHIWNEIPVLITFESDWKKAKRILSKIAEKHGGGMSEKAEQKLRRAAKRYMIFYNKLTPIVYTSVKESGVMLTIRYLCEPHKRRHTEELIWEDVLTAFGKEKDIDLAYPTQRFFTRPGTDTTDS